VGEGVVVATGPSTEVGRIADLAAATDTMQAPLQAGLEQLGRSLSLVVVGLVRFALAGLGWVRGLEVHEVVEVSIALAVAIVPEGLPAVATLTLTVGMRRMARQNALVRRLPTVETLGSTSVIASDKTGTLTANEMRVVEVHPPTVSTRSTCGVPPRCATTPTSHPTVTRSATPPRSRCCEAPTTPSSIGGPCASRPRASTRSRSTRRPSGWPS
jgi:P-type E1-E2 ATPase